MTRPPKKRTVAAQWSGHWDGAQSRNGKTEEEKAVRGTCEHLGRWLSHDFRSRGQTSNHSGEANHGLYTPSNAFA
jgi:hypothetical protein